MRVYYILKLNDFYLALDVLLENTSEEIAQLQSQGFVIAADNIRAKSSEVAVREYKATFSHKELTPLDKANQVIRNANVRVHELKEQLNAAESEIEKLNNLNLQLSSQLKEVNCSLTNKDILGYQYLPTSLELKKRYKNLASIHHPDKGGSRAMMQRLNNSYDELKKQTA